MRGGADSGSALPGCQSAGVPPPGLAVQPRASYSTSARLALFKPEVGLTALPASQGCGEDEVFQALRVRYFFKHLLCAKRPVVHGHQGCSNEDR